MSTSAGLLYSTIVFIIPLLYFHSLVISYFLCLPMRSFLTSSSFSDAKRMARDVHNTLLTIIQDYGKMELRDAENYIISLENAFRYQKDVWS